MIACSNGSVKEILSVPTHQVLPLLSPIYVRTPRWQCQSVKEMLSIPRHRVVVNRCQHSSLEVSDVSIAAYQVHLISKDVNIHRWRHQEMLSVRCCNRCSHSLISVRCFNRCSHSQMEASGDAFSKLLQ